MDMVQMIIQGGSVGVSIATLYTLYKITSNHIEHHEREMARFADALDKLSDAIKGLV